MALVYKANRPASPRTHLSWLCQRCEDDGRQITRWGICVGDVGRWRRALVKEYVQDSVHTVTDKDDEVDEKRDLSPIAHQA
ncbi:hypothetical protein F5Y12DRAFT_524609 [Xylaria sp. FL1777]|nr:hypothetical protein F5Y12DRAFT_524609 [Xylaria sp. FL1777]